MQVLLQNQHKITIFSAFSKKHPSNYILALTFYQELMF